MNNRVLVPAAQADRDSFEAEDGCCSCHISPPCGWCTHPGNPRNQENDPDAWVSHPEPVSNRPKRVRDW